MSKPTEIPNDVWDTAATVMDEVGDACGTVFGTSLGIGPLARAILAAEKRGEERERAACAAVADEYVWDDHALAQATAIGKAVHHQSVEIADAIRKRGEG